MSTRRINVSFKSIISVFVILLLLGSLVMVGTAVHDHFAPEECSSVTSNNVIASEMDRVIASEMDRAIQNVQSVSAARMSGAGNSLNAGQLTAQRDSSASAGDVELYLYKRNSGDNSAFSIGNMFPGDAQTQNYRVQVSYLNKITVKFHADIQPGYEKLAEVLKCRVVLLTTGEVMYDGLMLDMPASLNHTLRSDRKTTDELYYEITAYLDTSVGNEYMNESLLADFRWWVEETDNLTDGPKTGDSNDLLLWGGIVSGALLLLFLLLAKRKKEETQNEQQ